MVTNDCARRWRLGKLVGNLLLYTRAQLAQRLNRMIDPLKSLRPTEIALTRIACGLKSAAG